jgi:hypothetical protein
MQNIGKVGKFVRESTSMTLTADNMSHKVEKSYEIWNCSFRDGEALLVTINFTVMQNMNSNNSEKLLRREMGL